MDDESQQYIDPEKKLLDDNATWEFIRWARQFWSKPIVVKVGCPFKAGFGGACGSVLCCGALLCKLPAVLQKCSLEICCALCKESLRRAPRLAPSQQGAAAA